MDSFSEIRNSILTKVTHTDPGYTLIRKIKAKQKYIDAVWQLYFLSEDREEQKDLDKKKYDVSEEVEQLKRELKSLIRYSVLDKITDSIYEEIWEKNPR